MSRPPELVDAVLRSVLANSTDERCAILAAEIVELRAQLLTQRDLASLYKLVADQACSGLEAVQLGRKSLARLLKELGTADITRADVDAARGERA